MCTPKFPLIGYTIKEGRSKTIKISDNNTGEYLVTLGWNYFLNKARKIGSMKENIEI